MLLSAAPAWAQAPADGVSSQKEIIVTARRRNEAIQDVPLTVAAIGSEALETRGVHTEADLQIAIPGLVVRTSNNSNQLNYVMRGESVDAYSGSPPGVQPYINEVPFPTISATAFYDLASVQAVKGPQGTLFGRNSTGGAVLFQTQEPVNYFTGYASIQYGNRDKLIAEGALNLPLVDDKVLVRLAGTATSGGAYVRNLYDGKLLGDSQNRSGRFSLLLRPVESLTNVTTVQISKSTGTNAPNTMYHTIPCGDDYGFNSCTYSPDNQPFFDSLLAGGLFPGYPSGYVYPGGFEDLPEFLRSQGKYVVNANAPFFHRAHSEMVVNKTNFEVSPYITIKNVFGFSFSKNAINYDTDYSPYPIVQQYSPSLELTGEDLPVETSSTRTWSDELQIQGATPDDRLNWLAGVFYIDSTEDYFSPLWLGALDFSVAYNAKTGNRSFAVFGQATYKLTDQLSLTLGGRYTWEKITLRQLEQSIFGAGNPQQVKQDDPSWTVSLDYHVSPDLMLYATTRGSWRRGGFNPFNPPTATPTTAATGSGGNYFLPEKVRDAEIGIKYSGDGAGIPVRANVALYQSWVTNIQKTAYTVIGGTVSSATINVPKAKIKGIEADLGIQPASWLSLGGTMTYTDAKFTEATSSLFGQPVVYGPFGDVPKFSGSVYADTSLDLPGEAGSLNYHVEVYNQSSFYFSNLGGTLQPGTKLPAYTLVNMRLDWDEIMGSGVKASLFVKNLTGKVYYTGGSAGAQNFSVESATFGAPRTYGVALRVDF
ncbi:TonB-dependent receptor [Novosphingobium beihaiensis]|uniref:TonB-dependent receptor n=1 Tax=Novosphingobium beihaiensis TaxID=2930389 RepID=A0ABT0BWR5_9SPHN|nr:TonB-dependent receptor [Novosphingobium beihaiensis]MCJ2189104.1 TonB-dependent receptor [Novosphingobium beihaiensis]